MITAAAVKVSIIRAARWVLSSRPAQIVIAILAAVGWHKAQVARAKRAGATKERDRITQDAQRKANDIRVRSEQTRNDNSRLDDDELRRRMREQSRDRP